METSIPWQTAKFPDNSSQNRIPWHSTDWEPCYIHFW